MPKLISRLITLVWAETCRQCWRNFWHAAMCTEKKERKTFAKELFSFRVFEWHLVVNVSVCVVCGVQFVVEIHELSRQQLLHNRVGE